MITSAVSQQPLQEAESGQGNNNRLAVQPSQVSEWITTMRNRLNNIEQLMHNLERPHESITTENPNAQLQLDDADDLNSNAFLAELHADAVASGSEQNPSPIAPAPEPRGSSAHEAHVVRRSRRRREHGEEPSHVVATAAEEEAEPAPHEDQLPLTRKRRRRLD